MKKITIGILGLLMLAVVGAVAVGNIYTQEQVNNINVTGFDLEENFVRDGNNKINTTCFEGTCGVIATMISVDQEMLLNITDNSTYWSGDYVIINRNKTIRFNKKYWKEYAEDTDDTTARQELAKWLKKRRSMLVSQERTYLESIQ